MISLTVVADTIVSDVMSLTEVAEPVQEGINILELAMKGG